MFLRSFLQCAAVAAVFVLAGCSEDPGLQERVNRLQAETQQKDRQLQDAQALVEKTRSELKSAKAVLARASKPPPSDAPTPAFLAREQVAQSYAAASKAMQKRLADELRNYTVENCAEFPVVMPSDEYPYHSKIVVTVRSDNGHSQRLEFPVSADATGRWNFPDPSVVAGALADGRSQEAGNGPAGSPTPAPVNGPPAASSTPMPGMPSDRDVRIRW